MEGLPESIANALIDTQCVPMNISWDGRDILHWTAAYRFIQHCRAKKQAMEMTEYGKYGKP
jgi:hypothetical protein